MSLPTVCIHYLRPPGREDVFRQLLVHQDDDVRVTYARAIERPTPMLIDGSVALESGSDVVWFTFAGKWHDIARFYRADGTFTGIYANILTPPVFESDTVWRTTDLFLDVWLSPAGELSVLDQDEFEHAVQAAWIDEPTRVRASAEVDRILEAVRAGVWPPDVVREWTLERARAVAG